MAAQASTPPSSSAAAVGGACPCASGHLRHRAGLVLSLPVRPPSPLLAPRHAALPMGRALRQLRAVPLVPGLGPSHVAPASTSSSSPPFSGQGSQLHGVSSGTRRRPFLQRCGGPSSGAGAGTVADGEAQASASGGSHPESNGVAHPEQWRVGDEAAASSSYVGSSSSSSSSSSSRNGSSTNGNGSGGSGGHGSEERAAVASASSTPAGSGSAGAAAATVAASAVARGETAGPVGNAAAAAEPPQGPTNAAATPPPVPTPTTSTPSSRPSLTLRETLASLGGRLVRSAAKLRPLVETVALLCVWYSSNIFYNIYNKQVLSVFPYAMTCTVIHICTAIAMVSMLWLLRIKRVPVITRRTVQWVFPLSVLHLAGFLTTNMSLGAVNVSLTHTIKSLEPFFTVLLSLFFFGTLPSAMVLLTLVPIVAGVVVASATDLSFNWYGFSTAMGSNLAFQSRNVLSKKYMVESSLESLEGGLNTNEVLDEVDLFLCISIMALPLSLPIVLASDGAALAQRFGAVAAAAAAGGGLAADFATCAAGVMPADVFVKNLLAGMCRTADVFASYGLLSRLNPITHSVANCVKRVVVIAVSILFFKTQSSYLNILGTVLALSGVFAYSMAERMSPKRARLNTLPGQVPLSMSNQVGVWLKEAALAVVPAAVLAAWRDREARALEAQVRAAEEAAEAKAREEAARKAKQEGEPDYFL